MKKEQISRLCQEVFQKEPDLANVFRLGGLTNMNYCVQIDEERYVIRIPGEGTDEIINRLGEAEAIKMSQALGLDVRLIHFNEKTGAKISRFIEDCETLTNETIADKAVLSKIASILTKLHHAKADIKTRFDLPGQIVNYERLLKSDKYTDEIRNEVDDKLRQRVNTLVKHWQALGVQETPCHNDTLPANWLRTPERMYLLDWEYAGMNDPFWDLAAIALESEMDEQYVTHLLEAYCQGKPSPEELLRFHLNTVFMDYLWGIWGYLRAIYVNEEEQQEMLDYGRMRLARCATLVQNPIFKDILGVTK